MLAPEALTALLETPISDVHQVSFKTIDSLSGGHFLAIQTNQGAGPRLVLKRFSYDSDWIMRATDDHHGRAVLAWTTGLLDRLPPEIVHGYLACARDGSGWAILMHDLSTFLVPPGESPISAGENKYFVEAMSCLHASFWEEPHVVDPALGFSRLESDYLALSPQTGYREAGGDDPVPRLLLEGWDVLLATVEPALADALGRLAGNPAPLCDALRAFPQTVVHADWKLGNLGLIPGPRAEVILLDWARVLSGPAVVDLAWYLAVNCNRLPVSKEEAIGCYRRCLESRLGRRFDEWQWQAQLDLSLLGSFLQLGWSKALGAARGSSEHVRLREAAELSRVPPAISGDVVAERVRVAPGRFLPYLRRVAAHDPDTESSHPCAGQPGSIGRGPGVCGATYRDGALDATTRCRAARAGGGHRGSGAAGDVQGLARRHGGRGHRLRCTRGGSSPV